MTKNNQERKFTNRVLVRALEAKPGWIEIFFLQETAQTIRLNHCFSIFSYFRTKVSPELFKES